LICPVSLTLAGRSATAARIRDISERGALIRSSERPTPGALGQLTFEGISFNVTVCKPHGEDLFGVSFAKQDVTSGKATSILRAHERLDRARVA
jgi:hypothetical protein